MKLTLKVVLLALLPALATPPAQAHHSFGMFDQKQCVTVAGIVKKFQWSFPHVWLWLEAKGADEAPVIWGFEAADPATLATNGWAPELLKKGDRITVYFNPLKDGRKGGALRQVVLPTGKIQGAQVYEKDDTFFATCKPSGER